MMEGALQPRQTTVPSPGTAAFLEHLFPAPRDFSIRIGGGEVLPASGRASFTLVIRSEHVLRSIFRPPVEASLGNAFLRGDLEVEGDICSVFPLVEACRTAARSPRNLYSLASLWRSLPPGNPVGPFEPREAPSLRGIRHTEERDQAAIRYHYDLGNEFFELFLDRRMVYSAGYFRTREDDLDTAQEQKLEHVCRKLRLRPGNRLLDVGCGWGALLIYAGERFGVEGVGITLSERQRDLAVERVANAGLADRIEIRIQDYRDLDSGTFDRISSIGMFEHVGRARMPEYFARVRDALRPGGLFLNHGISRDATAPARTVGTVLRDPLNHLIVGTSPITRYVFPDSELLPLSEVNLAGERSGLEVRDVENLREHYDLTLRHWIARLDEKKEKAMTLVGAPTWRAWRLYFAASAYRFTIGRISVNQTLFAKPDRGRTGVPLTRADIYR